MLASTPTPATGEFDPAALARVLRQPEFETMFLGEPDLLFGERRPMPDPKTGLALYGPYDLTDEDRPARIRLGIVGTGATIDLARRWIDRCRSKVMPTRLVKRAGALEQDSMDPTVYPPFPGLEAVFRTEFVAVDSMCLSLTSAEVAEVKRLPIFETRVTRLIDLLIGQLRVLAEKTARPDVVLCALPTDLRDLCTVPSKHRTLASQPPTQARLIRESLAADQRVGQENLFDVAAAHGVSIDQLVEQEAHAVLHHGLKARAMEVGIPTQLVWQSTLEGSGANEDVATRAWNFWTGVYYKAGGTPWRVSGLEPGTCFVGVSFYRDKGEGTFRTSLAQAFSDRGEGIVLRGEPFRWDSLKSPHLSQEMAKELLTRVLTAYREHLHHNPSRVVVHKWQRYWADEKAGFEEAILAAGIHSSDLVAFGARDIRFFRVGNEPPIRSTAILLTPTNALLYSRGYVPFLRTYPGMRVPRPLEIVEHFGSAPMRQICREILALTKMDWNSAAFAGKAPITTDFAEDIGDILAEVPSTVTPRPSYRYYM